MIKKTFIMFLVVFILSSNTLFAYQKAEASTWADVPGYIEESFQSVMIGALTVGAAGIHANEYVTDNLQSLKDTAVETWNSYSPAMKQSFVDSLNSAGDRIVIAGDLITSFLDSFKAKEGSSLPVTDITYDPYAPEIKIPTGYKMHLTGLNPNGTVLDSYQTVSFRFSVGAESGLTRINMKIGSSSYYISQDAAVAYQAFDKFWDNPSMSTLNAFLAYTPVSMTLVNSSTGEVVSGEPSIALELDNYFKDNDIPMQLQDAGIVWSPPIPYTNSGVKLKLNENTGVLSLPDGQVYTGEIDWRLPNTTVRDIEGVAIPTTTTAQGDVVNILTGEVVIPAEVEIPPTTEPVTDFNKPTTTINWGPLMMNANALKDKFPFSIPWDFITQLGVFAVEPEAPKFEINIPNYFTIEDNKQSMFWELDFEQFDSIALIFRWFIIIVFDIALILSIRRLLPE